MLYRTTATTFDDIKVILHLKIPSMLNYQAYTFNNNYVDYYHPMPGAMTFEGYYAHPSNYTKWIQSFEYDVVTGEIYDERIDNFEKLIW